MERDELCKFTYKFLCEFIDNPPSSWTLYEEEQRRKEICLNCELYLPVRNVCKECGCSIPAKISEPMETCPLGKWEQHYESFEKFIFTGIEAAINGESGTGDDQG